MAIRLLGWGWGCQTGDSVLHTEAYGLSLTRAWLNLSQKPGKRGNCGLGCGTGDG